MTKRTFTYGRKKYVQLLLCLALIGMFSVMVTTGRIRQGDWPTIITFATVLIMGCAISLFIFLDVVVSEEGISKPFYCMPGRRLKWTEIDRVTYHMSQRGSYNYRIRPAGRPLLRSIYFTSSINDISQLTEVLNAELLKRNIPILEGLGDARIRVERLPNVD